VKQLAVDLLVICAVFGTWIPMVLGIAELFVRKEKTR
jgi:hypothetical protein